MLDKIFTHRDKWLAPGDDGARYRAKSAKEGRTFILEVPKAVPEWDPAGPDSEPPNGAQRVENFNEMVKGHQSLRALGAPPPNGGDECRA
jgi:hypothetical protein